MTSLDREPSPRIWNIGAPLADTTPRDDRPDWQQANPHWIEQAYEHAAALPTGGWYALCASRDVRPEPRRFVVARREIVVWRHRGALFAAPNACPHLGAPLDKACVRGASLVCPWHGLTLGPSGHGAWRPLETHDDGVLSWVRLDDSEKSTERPVLPVRPARFLDAVVRVEAQCEPEDVIRNRLDPWHGVHLHPYAFARLRVVDRQPSAVTVRVAYRVLGPICVEVDASFHCVDPRTVVMTITAGEGTGSVVETHATPLERGRTAIVEATLATSHRRGFLVALAVAPLVRPFIGRTAPPLARRRRVRRTSRRAARRSNVHRCRETSLASLRALDPLGQNDDGKRNGCRNRLHEEDALGRRQATEDAGNQYAPEKKEPERSDHRVTGEEAPGQAGGQKQIVEALIRREDRGLFGKGLGRSEAFADERRRPEKHLEHSEADVFEGNEGDERGCDDGHASAYRETSPETRRAHLSGPF